MRNLLAVLLLGLAPPSLAQVSARSPAIDVHVHLGGVWNYPGVPPSFSEITTSMAQRNVQAVVDFKAGALADGGTAMGIYGSRVDTRLSQYPDRTKFKLLANVPTSNEWQKFLGESMPGYPQWAASLAEDAISRGASGIKFRYNGGGPEGPALTFASNGDLKAIDAPEFDLMWKKLEELRAPVLMHLGPAYLADYSPTNWAKDWWFELLMHQRERVLRRYPKLPHIGAHLGSGIGALDYQAEMLSRFPNYFCELGAHVSNDIFGTVDSIEKAFLERHQDQLVFGTDYMEATMGWLTSYLQRLDMMLPFIEAWPISNSVFQKFYNGNASRIFRMGTSNTAPQAHPGFARTAVVGQPVVLSGTGSLDYEGSALSYQWSQVEGPPVALSNASSGAPSFVPVLEAVHTFELTVSDGALTSAARQVAVNAVADGEVFVEADGKVVIEAEHASRNTPRGTHQWKLETAAAGYSGDGYLEASPDNGFSVAGSFRAVSPQLEYKVFFTSPGSYVVLLRGSGPNLGGDSVHLGLDGEEVRFADQIGPLTSSWSWIRQTQDYDAQLQQARVGLAVVNVAEPGLHTIQVWMHEDGFRLDKLVLARHAAVLKSFPIFDPGTGAGPPESVRKSLGDLADAGTPLLDGGADLDGGGDMDGGAGSDGGTEGDGGFPDAGGDPKAGRPGCGCTSAWSLVGWLALIGIALPLRRTGDDGRPRSDRPRNRPSARPACNRRPNGVVAGRGTVRPGA